MVKAIDQKIKLHGKPVGNGQGDIPRNQREARQVRFVARAKQQHSQSTQPKQPARRSQKVKTNYRPMTRAQQEARERSPVHKAKEALGGFLGRGLENFARNQEEQERSERKGRPSNRPAAPAWGLGPVRGSGLNLDALEMGGGSIDLCLHPDPMVSGMCRGEGRRDRDHKPVRKVVTRTEYR